MSAAERADFEKRLSAEPDLVQRLREEEMVHLMVTLDNRRRLKERIARVMEEEKKSNRKPRRRYFRIVAAAAAVVFLAVLLMPRPSGPADPRQLYTENYAPMKNLIITMDGSGEIPEDLAAGMSFYDQRAFDEAIPLLETFRDSTGDSLLVRLYLGISFLETDQTPRARQEFAAVAARNNPFIGEYALWYLALAELRLGDAEAGKIHLKALVDLPSEGEYERRGRKLLEELE
jgi:hypothetical protein